MEYKSERMLVVDSIITEYDIKHANTSLMRYYNLYPEKLIDKIDRMKKIDREVYVGTLQRDNKEFSKKLMQGFDDMMELFLDTNKLSLEDDILSIKKDAAFVVNKPVKQVDFGCVHFATKNQYKHFACIGKYEYYIRENKEVDVKGIGDRDALNLHKDGMLKFINDLIDLYIADNKKEMYEYLHDFVCAYKARELPFDYYREFDSQSGYRFIDKNTEIILDDIDESVIDNIDIQWNYINVILPACRMFI